MCDFVRQALRCGSSVTWWCVECVLDDLLERGLPANEAPSDNRYIASSFFAGKPRSHRN